MPVRNVRRRYLVFHLNSNVDIGIKYLNKIFKNSISVLYGIKGLVDADLKLIEYKAESKTGILRCNHNFLKELRVALVLINEIDRENWSTGGELHFDKFGAGYGKNVSK